jgi:hypothetical protein
MKPKFMKGFNEAALRDTALSSATDVPHHHVTHTVLKKRIIFGECMPEILALSEDPPIFYACTYRTAP